MRITLHTDYALRVLLYLETHRGRLVATTEIAKAFGVSQHHLAKVAANLTEAQMVEAVRGRKGGIRLAMEASSINLGQIFRLFEPQQALVECFDPETNTCPITKACVLKRVLSDAEAAFLEVLDRYTLQDLVKSPGRYRQLLDVEGG